MSVKTQLKEKRAEKAEKAKALHTVFEEAGPELDMDKVKSIEGTSDEKAAQIKARNDELTELSEAIERLEGVEAAAKAAAERGDGDDIEDGSEPGTKSGTKESTKGIGERFVESVAFKEFNPAAGQGPVARLDMTLKTLFETSAGWAPESVRGPRLVLDEQRPIQVIDLIPQTETNQTAIKYMEETTFTNNAAEVAEGGTYGEAALALTEQSSAVRKIGTFIPVTDEQFEDEPRSRDYVENRLVFMVRQRLDGQLVVGNGTAPNLRGFLNVVGIQTQAKGGDPTPDAVYKAMTKVEVTGQAVPGAFVTHPNDWQEIRLLRTADGIYIWGNPSEAGPERIWGLRVVKAQAITEGTGLVGDFANFSELANRRGIDIQVSNSHSDYFVKGKLAVRADVRVALIVYRPTAFCQVTGI